MLAAANSVVMHCSILVHVPDASGVESATKEMLALEIPYSEILRLPLDLFIRHPVSMVQIFVFFARQC